MIIVNTTFHVPLQLKNALATWLRDVYGPSAVAAGHRAPRTARVLGGSCDDDGCSIAFQTEAATLAEAKRWHDGDANALRLEIARQLGPGKLAFFTTYLQTID